MSVGQVDGSNSNLYEKKAKIKVISENNISEKEALLNPQLHFKNPKHYLLNPDPSEVVNSNLFNYNKGLEIIFQYMSIIFTDKETYDFTSINLGELCYDGDTEIFFDDANYKKKKFFNEKIMGCQDMFNI